MILSLQMNAKNRKCSWESRTFIEIDDSRFFYSAFIQKRFMMSSSVPKLPQPQSPKTTSNISSKPPLLLDQPTHDVNATLSQMSPDPSFIIEEKKGTASLPSLLPLQHSKPSLKQQTEALTPGKFTGPFSKPVEKPTIEEINKAAVEKKLKETNPEIEIPHTIYPTKYPKKSLCLL